ncbi:hypothetical protein BJG93_06460 [Paraburkholderia sprentiae WSM5005]|uniref:Uncharacterized protein n=1 Tax=Paraburkholderia sprentiae WSM5005 TaxID=754502 RepID=A0A1I9YFH7_9BURK|nr:hypothetical protein [Paraburkholderia sprentiae]APA85060.1 hypothetical protein BJG93_06460 [Paraburkholderia sprentiae WSM5005]
MEARTAAHASLDPIAAHASLDPIAALLSFYVMAAALADARGRNPDVPRHLKKVTETHGCEIRFSCARSRTEAWASGAIVREVRCMKAEGTDAMKVWLFMRSKTAATSTLTTVGLVEAPANA